MWHKDSAPGVIHSLPSYVKRRRRATYSNMNEITSMIASDGSINFPLQYAPLHSLR